MQFSFFAPLAAPLPLHAGGLGPLLDGAVLIDKAHGAEVADDLGEGRPEPAAQPRAAAQRAAG
jgi:hypothetical protein